MAIVIIINVVEVIFLVIIIIEIIVIIVVLVLVDNVEIITVDVIMSLINHFILMLVVNQAIQLVLIGIHHYRQMLILKGNCLVYTLLVLILNFMMIFLLNHHIWIIHLLIQFVFENKFI